MSYWVVRIDGDLPTLSNGAYSEVTIQYPTDDYEEAKKTAEAFNIAEARRAEQRAINNGRGPANITPGTTIVCYKVISDDGLPRYYQLGTHVVRG